MYQVSIPIVSLDKIYLGIDNRYTFFLDCTRLDKSSNLVSRKNPDDKYSVDNQITKISTLFKKLGTKEIVLSDDVVFSGSVLKTVIDKFSQNGISVVGIRSCVSTREGYDYFNQNLPLGLKCGFLMSKDVIDQICERDFYYGIVGSGISVVESGKVKKAPYFKPFGEPVERASIPYEQERYFSFSCLKRSICLWSEMEKLNKREILVSELPEAITYSDDSDSIVKTLKKGLITCIRQVLWVQQQI